MITPSSYFPNNLDFTLISKAYFGFPDLTIVNEGIAPHLFYLFPRGREGWLEGLRPS